MAETVQKLFLDARALIDELTDDGTMIPDADVIDLQNKFVRFADMAQKELYKIGKLYKNFERYNSPYKNLLGTEPTYKADGFTGVKYFPDENGTIANAYSFECGNESTWEIEENQSEVWTVIDTISVPDATTELTLFNGIIAATGKIRIKATSSYYTLYRNVALFAEKFSVNNVPQFRTYFKLQMPSDFRSLDQITEESPIQGYDKCGNFKWEGFKNLYVNYNYEGDIRIIYKPIPADITQITDTLEVDDVTAQAITYYGAARLATFENQSLVSYFEQKYNELKEELSRGAPVESESIIDVYGGYYGYI